MKYLYIVRHAKSDWPADTKDFDRPLSARGMRDAPKMAAHLLSMGVRIDKFISSPAKRAIATCKYFAEAYHNNDIEAVDKLYMAAPEDFTDTILQIGDRHDHVALFSHNNGLTYFVNALTNENIGHVPTCGVAAFRVHTGSWADFVNAEKEFLFFYYPKMLA